MNSRKPKLLLLHGALGCAKQFDALIPHLHTFEIHRYDFPEHGTRAKQNMSHLTLTACAEDLLAYIKKSDLTGCTVFGHSMGGYCAALCESLQPQTFSKIITLGTKWEWNEEIATNETAKLNLQMLWEKAPAFVRRMNAYHGSQNTESLFKSIIHLMTDLGKQPPLLHLSGISCPIHIYRGELDRMVSEEESLVFASTNTLTRYYQLDQTKHAYEDVQVEDLKKILMMR